MDSGGFSLNSADNKGILSLLSAIEQTGDNFETDPESPEPIKDHIEGHETAFNQLEGKEDRAESTKTTNDVLQNTIFKTSVAGLLKRKIKTINI